MKKLLALLLCLVMVLGLCACGESGAGKTGLQVGYGRENAVPGYAVNLAGSASDRESEGYMDTLYVTCVALAYGEERFLLVTADLVGMYEEHCAETRSYMSQELGIPEDNILLNSTHTHASVSIRNASNTGAGQYRQDFNKWAVRAAETALEDLAPAEIWQGSIMTEGMVWVRHYKMSDGTYAGSNFGSFTKSSIEGHVKDADGELQVVKFARSEEGKEDIVLMNLGAHATMNGSSKVLSADFPGPARDYVEQETGAHVAYFIAAAGDQVPSSRISGEAFSTDYQVYGAEVGRLVVECLQNMTKVNSGEITLNKRTFVGNSNKEGMDRIEDAQAVQAIWNSCGGRGTDKGKAAAKEYGFESVYEVTAILNQAGTSPTRSMELKTLAVGDVSFIFAPYEMFGASGRAIKDQSPYEMTFVITCSYDHQGYLPTELGWEINCYEAQITKFAPGTAETLVEEYVDMLTEMKTGAAETAQ